MKKCSKGHEGEGKHCGDCGEMFKAEDATLAKCASCEHENPAGAKFCAECAAPFAKAAEASFDAAIEELTAFADARASLTAKASEVTVEIDDAQAALDAGEVLNAGPLLATFAKAVNDMDLRSADAAVAVETGLGTLAKALSSGLVALRSQVTAGLTALDEKLTALAGTPRGRAGARPVQLFTKALPEAAGADDANDTSLGGGELVAKATQLTIEGKLLDTDATLTQSYVQRGVRTLSMLAKAGPEAAALAGRLARAIPKAEQAA